MKFIITAKSLPAKKNDILFTCRGKFPTKYKSEKQKNFEEEAVYQLIPQKRKLELPITTLVEVHYKIYLNHRITTRDKDNIMITINDTLEDNQILKNDALIYRSISEKFLIDKNELEKVEIEILPYQRAEYDAKQVDKN